MNKRVLSSNIGYLKSQSLIQQNIDSMQKEHEKNQIQYLKKQNGLLKKQLEQIKSVYSQTKKQLNLYRGMLQKKYVSQDDYNSQMAEVFEMQQKKIFDLQTELQILRQKYNKSILHTGESTKQTEYAFKCKQLQKRLLKCESQYQRQISNLKQKLMKFNASELMMQKSKSSNFIPSVSTELKPISSKFNRLNRLYE